EPSAVRFGERDEIRVLEEAALHALQSVASAGEQEHEHDVRDVRDRDLALPDPDALDDDHLVAARLEHDHRFARARAEPSRDPAGRARTHERLVARCEPPHARPIAEQAPAGSLAGRIHGEHAHAVAPLDGKEAEGVDERALAGARRSRDAEPQRSPRMRKQQLEEPLRGFGVRGEPALDEGDGPRERRSISRTDALRKPLRVETHCERPSGAASKRSRIACAIATMALPGPNTAATPRSRSTARSRSGTMPPTTTRTSRAPTRSSASTSSGTKVRCAPAWVETPMQCTSLSSACLAASSGLMKRGPSSTSKPTSASPPAITLAPRSWPS